MSIFRSTGFTLVELMITLMVAAILVTMGVPAFRDLMIKSRLSGQVQGLYGAISFARSEAIKRGSSVTLCRSADGSNCDTNNSFNWSNGWIVFANNNDDNPPVRNNIGAANEEPLLRVFPALTANYTLYADSNFKFHITFDRPGMAHQAGTFVFCANSDESKARAIIITRTRLRIATDSNGNGAPEKENGNDITSCENP